MNETPYEFTLPYSAIKVQWKRLKVGQQIDLGSSYTGASAVRLQPALYAARVVKFGEKDRLSLAEMEQWDEIDYTAFTEHVDAKEAEVYASYKPKETAVTASQRLAKAAVDCKEAMIRLSKQMEDMLAAAKAAELASSGPLSQPK